MRNRGLVTSFNKKPLRIFILICIFVLGIALQEGLCQFNPYFPVAPFMPLTYYPPVPLLPPPLPFFPLPQLFPTLIPPLPYSRAPQATIILSTGITAVSPTAGAIVIGAPTVVTPTIASTVPAIPTVAAPAPLLGVLATLYASAIYSHSALSTANPLLFAYLSTLLI